MYCRLFYYKSILYSHSVYATQSTQSQSALFHRVDRFGLEVGGAARLILARRVGGARAFERALAFGAQLLVLAPQHGQLLPGVVLRALKLLHAAYLLLQLAQHLLQLRVLRVELARLPLHLHATPRANSHIHISIRHVGQR